MRHFLWILFMIVCIGCSEDPLFGDQSRHDLWLLHEGAELPIVVEGNTNSKIFMILLHGGPGGSTQDYNAGAEVFSDALEENHAMVYYDQRNAGLARGEWDEAKLTIEQHIEDLDKVIDLLNYKYGDDIKIFLSGHSWGGYLGSAYLFDEDRRSKVKAWINISGNTHRNLRNKHNLETIVSIANQQIAANVNLDKWTILLNECEVELASNVVMYNEETEAVPNGLKSRAADLIFQDGLVQRNFNSIVSALYADSYDPFMILANDRKGTLVNQMYAFDQVVEQSLSLIDIPVLSIYGKYDVTTSPLQGEYLINNISTLENDKKMVVLVQSAHSCMKNESLLVAQEMIDWVEKYQ